MNLLDTYLEYCRPLKGSTHFHRWSLVSVIGALLERRVWLDRKRQGVLFPNTYIFCVGTPATGKGYATQTAIDFYKRVTHPNRKKPKLGPSKITQAAMYRELSEGVKTYRIPPFGELKQSPVYFYASELSTHFEDFGGGTVTNELLDFYDSKGLEVIVEKRTEKFGIMTLHNPSVTLLAGTTSGYLQGAASHGLISSGLSSRIIFVVETRFVEKQRKEVEVDQKAEKEITEYLNEVYKLQGAINFEPESRELYELMATEADQLCFASNSEFYQNYFGRKPDNLVKVAMAFAAMRHSTTILSQDLILAKSWLDELEPNMHTAFGLRSVEKDSNLGEQIFNALPFNITVARKDLLQTFMKDGKFIPMNGSYDAAIKSLMESDSVKTEVIGSEVYLTKIREKLS